MCTHTYTHAHTTHTSQQQLWPGPTVVFGWRVHEHTHTPLTHSSQPIGLQQPWPGPTGGVWLPWRMNLNLYGWLLTPGSGLEPLPCLQSGPQTRPEGTPLCLCTCHLHPPPYPSSCTSAFLLSSGSLPTRRHGFFSRPQPLNRSESSACPSPALSQWFVEVTCSGHCTLVSYSRKLKATYISILHIARIQICGSARERVGDLRCFALPCVRPLPVQSLAPQMDPKSQPGVIPE